MTFTRVPQTGPPPDFHSCTFFFFFFLSARPPLFPRSAKNGFAQSSFFASSLFPYFFLEFLTEADQLVPFFAQFTPSSHFHPNRGIFFFFPSCLSLLVTFWFPHASSELLYHFTFPPLLPTHWRSVAPPFRVFHLPCLPFSTLYSFF